MAMIISADMRCRYVALFVTALGIAMAASNHIQTVNSWADYRAILKSMGRSDADIDGAGGADARGPEGDRQNGRP
jgi:hypothetical protein